MEINDKEVLQRLIDNDCLYNIFYETYTELIDICMCLESVRFKGVLIHINQLYNRLIHFSAEIQEEIIQDIWNVVIDRLYKNKDSSLISILKKWEDKIQK